MKDPDILLSLYFRSSFSILANLYIFVILSFHSIASKTWSENRFFFVLVFVFSFMLYSIEKPTWKKGSDLLLCCTATNRTSKHYNWILLKKLAIGEDWYWNVWKLELTHDRSHKTWQKGSSKLIKDKAKHPAIITKIIRVPVIHTAHHNMKRAKPRWAACGAAASYTRCCIDTPAPI